MHWQCWASPPLLNLSAADPQPHPLHFRCSCKPLPKWLTNSRTRPLPFPLPPLQFLFFLRGALCHGGSSASSLAVPMENMLSVFSSSSSSVELLSSSSSPDSAGSFAASFASFAFAGFFSSVLSASLVASGTKPSSLYGSS